MHVGLTAVILMHHPLQVVCGAAAVATGRPVPRPASAAEAGESRQAGGCAAAPSVLRHNGGGSAAGAGTHCRLRRPMRTLQRTSAAQHVVQAYGAHFIEAMPYSRVRSPTTTKL